MELIHQIASSSILGIVGLAGLGGVVVFGLLSVILWLKNGPWFITEIVMGVCFLAVLASAVLLIVGRMEPVEDHSASPDSSDQVQDGGSGGANALAGKEEVAELVLLDEQDILITAKGLNRDGIFGADLKILIENNSQQDITVQARNASVNGYMVDTVFSAEVAAGKKANDAITFVSSDLQACDIQTIADLEFSFHIFDSDWKTVLDSQPVKVATSAAADYSYAFDDSGKELCNQNGVRVIGRGFSDDQSIFGPGLVLFIENSTEKDATIQVRDVSVNGFMVDAIFSEDVCAGKHAVTAITIMNSSLKESGIDQIQEMEFYFHIFESEGWETIFDSGKIVVNAQQ